MKKYIKHIAFTIVLLTIGSLILLTTTTTSQFGLSDYLNQKEPQEIDCGSDLQLDRAAKELKGNKAALAILKNNCLILFGNFLTDLQNSGNPTHNLVFWGAGAGCGSCRTQTIYVLSPDDKVIFNMELDDPQIKTLEMVGGQNALLITEPVRKDSEPLSSPTSFMTTTYLWDKERSQFVKPKRAGGAIKVIDPAVF